MQRDFTFIDDITDGILLALKSPPKKEKNVNTLSNAPFRLLNLGNNKPENLMYLIEILEKKIGKKAKINFLPMQQGDVKLTYADLTQTQKLINYKPTTTLENGLTIFVEWYKKFYNK